MADYISVQEAFKTAAQYGKDYTDKKVNPLAEEIAVVSRAVDEKIAPIAREVDSLGDVVAKNTADITEQKDAVDKINDELVDIKYDVSAQTTRIGELYQEVEKATDKVDRMATDVGVLKSNKADKTYVDAEVKKVDDKYKAEIRRVDGKIDSTKADVETELGAIKEDIGNLSDLTFDATNMVDAVNKAYNHGGGGGSDVTKQYVDNEISKLAEKTVIWAEDSKSYYHGGLYADEQKTLDVTKNTYFSNIKIFNKKGYRPEGYTRSASGVTQTATSNITVVNGTPTESVSFYLFANYVIPDELKGKTVSIHSVCDKVVNMSSTAYGNIQIDGVNYKSITSANDFFNAVYTVDIPATATKMTVKYDLKANTVIDNATVFCVVYESNAQEVTASVESETSTSKRYVGFEENTELDTYVHISSIVTSVNTKVYVDEKIEEIINTPKLPYAYPEQFGAKGDGVSDDTIPLQSCIDYAVTNKLPVRAYGRYKISSMLNFFTDNGDLEINYLNYLGSDAALKIQGTRNRVKVNTIESKGIGIWCSSTTKGFAFNEVNVVFIDSTSHCIALYPSNTEIRTYANCHYTARYLRSASGSCFYAKDVYDESTVDFGDCTASSTNYAFHIQNAGTYNVLNANFEHSYLGFYIKYGTVNVKNCRIRELCDKQRSGVEDIGTAIYLDGIGSAIYGVKNIDFNCVKLNREFTYDGETGEVLSSVDSTGTSSSYLMNIGISNRFYNYRYYEEGSGKRLGNEYFVADLVVYGNTKGLLPHFDVISTITEDMDLNDMIQLPAKKYVVGLSGITLKLDGSYHPNIIKEFVVDQTSHTCSIYDKNDNLIFDGASYGSGIYSISCCSVTKNIESVYWGAIKDEDVVWSVKHIDSYSKDEIDSALGSYIDDVANLVGGDA